MRHLILSIIASVAILTTLPLSAEVVSSSANLYVLKHEAHTNLTPNELWVRLTNPAQWWHPEHTYSGDSDNLSLELKAGGAWREDWGNNSVLHGSILLIKDKELLRLNAPFGPLQELGVNVVWTISLKPKDNGTLVTFKEVANGNDISKLNELAKTVDFVKGEAIKRLTKNKKSLQQQ